jgi:hypothetical protein
MNVRTAARPAAAAAALGATLLGAAATGAAASPAVDVLRRHVEFLASADLEGRLTGTEGERRAAEHIARELERIGAKPLPGTAGFAQPFEFTSGTEDAGSTLALRAAAGGPERAWRGVEHVRALSFSDDGSASGPVVFAGYGLTLPEGGDVAYDSYDGLDVRDKIVLVLRYAPEDAPEETRATLARYSGLRYKALGARERGARALLVAAGPRSPHAGETVETSFDAALSGSGILAASVSGEVIAAMFERAGGRSVEEVQRALDSGDPGKGFEIPGLVASLETRIVRERRTGANVIGVLPAVGEARLGGYVMLGAHYDHLGRGRHGNSRAGREEIGQVHPGADDNASGVAAVLGIGARLADAARPRPVVLAFWSGEELGLLGSTHFVNHPAIPLAEITAYLNFDMVGRMRDSRLDLQAVGSSSAWPGLIERSNVVVGLDVRTQSDPYLPTDATALYQAKVPTLHFFTGSHDDYHRPTDVPGAVNYPGIEQIVSFATQLAGRLLVAEPAPAYVAVERKAGGDVGPQDLRTYTGTIPDYSSEVDGLRLSGVVQGGPAEQAGLREGDVIVEFAGRRIANIYDYTYALAAVKVGVPVPVVVVRDGERQALTITPTGRP